MHRGQGDSGGEEKSASNQVALTKKIIGVELSKIESAGEEKAVRGSVSFAPSPPLVM